MENLRSKLSRPTALDSTILGGNIKDDGEINTIGKLGIPPPPPQLSAQMTCFFYEQQKSRGRIDCETKEI